MWAFAESQIGKQITSDQRPFVMALASDPAESVTMTWYVKVITEAFRRLEMDLQVEVYPPVRASRLLDAGMVDGEGLRPEGYEDEHEVAVRVDELMFEVTFGAATTDPEINIQSFEDFTGQDLTVEYVRGTDPLDSLLSARLAPGNLSAVSTAEQGLEKLLVGRTDVFVDFPGRIRYIMAETGVAEPVVFVTNISEQVPIYPYVHKRHADLAPRLAAVLKDIRAEGLFEDYMQKASRELEGEIQN